MKKLDLSGVRVYTKNDIIDVMSLIGEKVYVSNTKDFGSVENYGLFKLAGVKFVSNKDECFIVETLSGTQLSYSYLIPARDAKFKKEENLRPFKSMKEFFDETGFNIGEVIQIKRFGNCTYEEKSIINGFRVLIDEESHSTSVIFGSCSRSFEDLFQNFKYLKNNKWMPFGIGE